MVDPSDRQLDDHNRLSDPPASHIDPISGCEGHYGHTESGTLWDPLAAERYASARHGADGNLLLDPHFLRAIDQHSPNKLVADIGCGACPWSVHAINSGAALVLAIDNADGMVEQAKSAVANAEMRDRIIVSKGDAFELDWSTGTIQLALSINVGCNLATLQGHIDEMARVLEADGRGVITAPDNFGILFTDGTNAQTAIRDEIQARLSTLPAEAGLPEFKVRFDDLDEVLRATFGKVDGNWQLIDDPSVLASGAVIFRKIPGLVVPNRYHAVDEYLQAIEHRDDLVIEELTRAVVPDSQTLLRYNSSNQGGSLGAEYTEHNPFAVVVVRKADTEN